MKYCLKGPLNPKQSTNQNPTILMIEGQGPISLALGAGLGCLDILTLLYFFSPLSPSLWEMVRYRLKYSLKGPLGWSAGAMMLGNLPTPGRPTIWITVGQGPTTLAVGAGGVVWTFLLLSIFSFLFLPLFGRRPDID